jgi:hypothetical protein
MHGELDIFAHARRLPVGQTINVCGAENELVGKYPRRVDRYVPNREDRA